MTKKVMKVIGITDDNKKAILSCEKCGWIKEENFHIHTYKKNVRILDIGTNGWECSNPKNNEKCEIAENEKREDYCSGQESDCKKCEFSFNGRDCRNNLI